MLLKWSFKQGPKQNYTVKFEGRNNMLIGNADNRMSKIRKSNIIYVYTMSFAMLVNNIPYSRVSTHVKN